MATDLQQFAAGSLAKSLNSNMPDFQADIQLTFDTLNVTSGIQEGIGPRYGISPIPGHCDSETVASGQYPGLQADENDAANPRVGFFGFFPIRMGGVGSFLNTVSDYFMALISHTNSIVSGLLLDALVLSTENAGVTEQSPLIYSGIPPGGPTNTNAQVDPSVIAAFVGAVNANKTTALGQFLTIPNGTTQVCAAPVTVTGTAVPMKWMGGVTTSPGDLTHAPNIDLSHYTGNLSAGLPSQFNYQNYKNGARTAAVFSLNSSNDWNGISWSLTVEPTNAVYIPRYLDLPGSTQIDLSAFTASATTTLTPPVLADTVAALYNDEQLTIDSSYRGLLAAAGGKAYGFLVQDWYRTSNGALTQYIDLVNMSSEPPIFGIQQVDSTGTKAPTTFIGWPEFIRGTPMAKSTGRPFLGDAGTGLLQAGTVYEFSYSIFDKRLNFESNVSQGLVKFQTPAVTSDPTNNNFSLVLFDQSNSNFSAYTMFANGSFISVNPPDSTNYTEYRFYYRQEGMQQWLPALFIDAAKFYFFPNGAPMVACTGAIGGNTGGTPGGFNDYSKLPADNYTCTLMYKNRAFWFSDKSMTFSLTNNIFAYPQRNSASCPIGSFKGGIVQAYYGQAQQDARLVVFSTTETFVGKFTGNPDTVPVIISVNGGQVTSGVFPLDGSDFELNAWTSVTAFSYRAAVVAQGVLFFWGPQGAFQDDGVNPITRISIPIEPDIFTLYDPSQTDFIHANYNDTTKEIVWFYKPKVADANNTHALVFNMAKGSWLPLAFKGIINSADTIQINTDIPTAGTRTVISSQQAPGFNTQRGWFFDQNNRSGDMFPGSQLLVKAVSTPVPGQRRLTLAAGHGNTALITIGGSLCLQQNAAYTDGALAHPADFIGEVVDVDVGGTYIDILLPNGVNFDTSATISNNWQFFPVWSSGATPTDPGIMGIPWTLATKYWVPGGMSFWGLWLYFHLMFKTEIFLPDVKPLQLDFAYRTPVSPTDVTNVLTLTNNSDLNCQIFHPMDIGNMNMEGQGLRLTFSGVQIGSEWVLQCLETMARRLQGDMLRIFEG